MQLDESLRNDFIAEVALIEKELAGIVRSLEKDLKQPKAFEAFGQAIDRVYGTAATFGLKEIASYCGMLKKVCYDCSKSNSPRGQQKVLGLLQTCLANLDALRKGIADPEGLKRLHHGLHLEEQKAERLHEEIFQFNKKS